VSDSDFIVPSGGVESLTYFATDGNYGDASGLTIIDTTGWTSDDFEMFDVVRDEDRITLARLISEWKDAEDKAYFHPYFAKLDIPEDYYAS
jgi:hypothetical protein